jgi:Glutaredoxin-like domain (DUF836)
MAARVRVFVADGCGLCGEAIEVVRSVCGDGYAVVDVTGDPQLEPLYRERIPVVEVDGVDRFTYVVEPEALRALL